jgi:hypothetical protein
MAGHDGAGSRAGTARPREPAEQVTASFTFVIRERSALSPRGPLATLQTYYNDVVSASYFL